MLVQRSGQPQDHALSPVLNYGSGGFVEVFLTHAHPARRYNLANQRLGSENLTVSILIQ